MSRKIVGLALGSLIILAGLGIVREVAQAAPGVTVSLAVSPVTYNGDCPVQITYNVAFKVTGFCSIKYHLISAKGKSSEAYSLGCKGAGTYKAAKTIAVTGSYSGWVAVQVTAPVSVQSNKVMLQIKCQPKPHITSAKLNYGGDPIPEIDISGSGFGASQGTKNIQVDGVLVSSKPGWNVLHWSDTSITINTTGVIPWDRIYQIAVTEGSIVVSKIYSAKFLYTIDGVNPGRGVPGSTVQVTIWSLPSAQGSYSLMVGGRVMPIVSWGGGITAKVPADAPPQDALLGLYKDGKFVSNLKNFRVMGPPKILGVHWKDCNAHSSTQVVHVWGTDFGLSQGTKQVKIGTLSGLTISFWNFAVIDIACPNNIVPRTQTYPVRIVDGNETISNTVETRFDYYLVDEWGPDLIAGSIAKVSVYRLPATQGAMTLNFNSAPVEIVSWQSPDIEFRVPDLPGTAGPLTLLDAGVIVSQQTGKYWVIK